jgi:hypothetical protein
MYMKRLYSLFLMALVVMTINAKTFTTTLWEDTYTSAIELNSETVATFKAGDVLRVYVTVPEGGANIGLSYKSEGNGWVDTAIPSVGNTWPWVNGGNTYYDVTFTAADITALSGQNIYIAKGDNSTINKVELSGEVTPTGGTELLDEEWTASWTAKTFAAQSSAKIGDVIRFSYSAPGSWSYFQFNILAAYGNADAFTNTATNVATSIETAADLYFDFEITNVSDMLKIQNEGFGIKGDNFTLTSVKLLTYADSYDAAEVEIGEDGIATWSYSKNLDFTGSGITAYYASAVTTGSVTLTATETTWNYCGYILKGEEGKYTIRVVSDSEASYPSGNLLKGNVGESTVKASKSGDSKFRYIFAKNGTDIGFYKLTKNHTLGAHRAYLETETDITPSSGSGARVVLDFDDDPTAITEIKDEVKEVQQDNVYYNLNGQRVEKPTKGIYIKNGKKVLF